MLVTYFSTCSSQLVAVKQLDMNYPQNKRYFLVEVVMLNLLHHQSLISMVGYCSEGSHMLIVYEPSQLGSLEDHLFGKKSIQSVIQVTFNLL